MKPISEIEVTRGIVERFTADFLDSLQLDVAVIGGGPSGMTCAYYLARDGLKVAVFERNLHVGGGMWGGGMLFPRIVLQDAALEIVCTDLGCRLEPFHEGYHVGDSVEVVSRTCVAALDAGVRVWVGVSVEDVLVREEDRVSGVVINWRAVELAALHVDPLALEAKVVIDATGHEAGVVHTVQRKIPGARLFTETGKIIGEKPMWAEVAEANIEDYTREVYPGLLVAGMAANAVYGAPRMGAIFGGMFLSGKKAAGLAAEMVRRS